MTLTRRQQKIREKHITASETPAMLGLDPERTPMDLWLLKTGQTEPQELLSEAAQIGHMVEPGLVYWLEKRIECQVRRSNPLRVHRDGILSCTHDALIVGRPEAVQAKSSGLTNRFANTDQWGEEGTDQVPEHVIVQCQAEMAVSDLNRVWVPALIGGRGRILYVIDRNQEIIDMLLTKAGQFWKYIADKIPPENGGMISDDYLRRRIRVAGKTIQCDDVTIIDRYHLAKQARKNSEEEYEAAKSAVLAAMEDAEELVFADGRSITNFQYSTRRIDTVRMRIEHRDLIEEYVTELKYRRLYLKDKK